MTDTVSAGHAYLDREFGAGGRRTFVADPHIQTTAGGRSIVRMQQQAGGIPLFGEEISLRIEGDRVIDVVGDITEGHFASQAIPSLSPGDAVIAALGHFRPGSDRGVCTTRHTSAPKAARVPTPAVIASFAFPSRPTVLRIGRTSANSAAYLAWWRNDSTLRLVWVVRLAFRAHTYMLLVGADDERRGDVVLCARWSAAACFGHVFSFDHGAGPQRLPFPFSAAGLPQFLALNPPPQLGAWMTKDQTEGNNVVTFAGKKQSLLQAAKVDATNDLEFPQFAPASREQMLLNAFFYCNLLHDFFLMLGFGEAEGNFQLANTGGGKAGDRLEVRVFDQKNPELGRMEALSDGETAVLKLSRAPNGEPAALHADVVTHEYAHGVVHRMVGGRLATSWLVQQQSQAMDEGWADYFAITLRNHYLLPGANYDFGDWAGGGVRSASYAPAVQRSFGNLGKSPNGTINGAGEIFAAALIRFNEFLGVRINDPKRGHCIGWRSVVESLRLINANPNFLDGKKALIGGIDELEQGGVVTAGEAMDARAAAREAFARYGMGKNSKSPDSSFQGTTPDTTVET